MRLKWKTRPRDGGLNGYLGEIRVAAITWDAMLPKGSKNFWEVNIFLPGVNITNYCHRERFSERGSAVQFCQEWVDGWVTMAGLEKKCRKIKRR